MQNTSWFDDETGTREVGNYFTKTYIETLNKAINQVDKPKIISYEEYYSKQNQ